MTLSLHIPSPSRCLPHRFGVFSQKIERQDEMRTRDDLHRLYPSHEIHRTIEHERDAQDQATGLHARRPRVLSSAARKGRYRARYMEKVRWVYIFQTIRCTHRESRMPLELRDLQ